MVTYIRPPGSHLDNDYLFIWEMVTLLSIALGTFIFCLYEMLTIFI